MPNPQISYYLPGLAGAGPQAVSNADRPLCALMAAYHAAGMGERVKERGVAVGVARIMECLAEKNIPVERVELWAKGLEGQTLEDFKPVAIEGYELSSYQVSTIRRIRHGGSVLNLAPGLGKTLPATAAAAYVAKRYNAASRCWVVCPLNAFAAWREFEPYLKTVFADVLIVSIDSLHKAPAANVGGVLIMDEAHQAGEDRAGRTKKAHNIRPMFDWCFALTGTLQHGGIQKALSVLDLTVPGATLFSSKWRAGEHFRCLTKKDIGGRSVTGFVKPAGESKERWLRYLDRFVISMTKHSPEVKSDITIPEQILHTVEIGDCSRSLTDLAVEYIQRAMAADPNKIPHAAEVAQALCRSGVEGKINWLLSELDDEPIVILANYTDSLDAVQKALEDNKLTFARIDGTVTGRKREEQIARFQSGEVQHFIGQITAAGISANLQRAFVSVAIDVNWRAADYAQALARTCRRGSTHEAHHFDLVDNRLQRQVVDRLRAAMDFDASTAAWQSMKTAIALMKGDKKSEAAIAILIDAFKDDPETIAAKAENKSDYAT